MIGIDCRQGVQKVRRERARRRANIGYDGIVSTKTAFFWIIAVMICVFAYSMWINLH
jgi:hypothetical protein